MAAKKKTPMGTMRKIIYAFLDVTDGMEHHDYFQHMGGTQVRANEVAHIRREAFKTFGKAWLKWSQSERNRHGS